MDCRTGLVYLGRLGEGEEFPHQYHFRQKELILSVQISPDCRVQLYRLNFLSGTTTTNPDCTNFGRGIQAKLGSRKATRTL